MKYLAEKKHPNQKIHANLIDGVEPTSIVIVSDVSQANNSYKNQLITHIKCYRNVSFYLYDITSADKDLVNQACQNIKKGKTYIGFFLTPALSKNWENTRYISVLRDYGAKIFPIYGQACEVPFTLYGTVGLPTRAFDRGKENHQFANTVSDSEKFIFDMACELMKTIGSKK